MISVLMSIYKEPLEWICESINSILTQSYQEFEFIIVIDNPELKPHISDFLYSIRKKDNRIKLYFNEKNIGLANSMNFALLQAKGDLIARMDADDISLPNRLEEEMQILIKSDSDIVSSTVNYIDISGKLIETQKSFDEKSIKLLPYYNCINHPTILMKKSALIELCGYRDFKYSQDYDLWLRMYNKKMKFTIINNPLLNYRISESQISSQKKVEQFFTSVYQRKLYYERKLKGNDSFSSNNLTRYINKKTNIQSQKKNYYCSLNTWDEIYKSKNKFSKLIFLIKAIYYSPLISILKIKWKIMKIIVK